MPSIHVFVDHSLWSYKRATNALVSSSTVAIHCERRYDVARPPVVDFDPRRSLGLLSLKFCACLIGIILAEGAVFIEVSQHHTSLNIAGKTFFLHAQVVKHHIGYVLVKSRVSVVGFVAKFLPIRFLAYCGSFGIKGLVRMEHAHQRHRRFSRGVFRPLYLCI